PADHGAHRAAAHRPGAGGDRAPLADLQLERVPARSQPDRRQLRHLAGLHLQLPDQRGAVLREDVGRLDARGRARDPRRLDRPALARARAHLRGRQVKAAYYQARRELDVREAPDPEPGPNEVLVRVAACGICGTDQHIYEGDFFPTYPLIGGHELAGHVVALGPQKYETALREGDRVAVDPSLFCG